MKLPSSIKRDLKNYKVLSQRISRLGGKNMQFISKDDQMLYLKMGHGIAAEALSREKIALEWLIDKKIIVPKVLNYQEDDDGEAYLLLSAIKGWPAQKTQKIDKNNILKIVADALGVFHSIDKRGAENFNNLDKDLGHIRRCIGLKLIKVDDFQISNNGNTPEQIHAYLLSKKGLFSSDTFVHGDFCLPNLVITNNSFGFIDVGDCGIGDPYKDYSALEVSIVRNFGKEWIDVFYSYFKKKLQRDQMKIEYYQYIDQFSYHLDIDKYFKVIRRNNKNR